MTNIKLAISVAAMTLLMGTASIAQQADPGTGAGRVDADGMPTTLSTPAEKAATADLNRQIGVSNSAVDTKAAAGDADYQAQQQLYQRQLQHSQAQQQAYQDQTDAYNGLHERYAAERAAYHRSTWPVLYVSSTMLDRDAGLTGERVQLIGGKSIGTVANTARGANGKVTALLVKLDDDKIVWIDATDIRYNRADGVVMTDLDREDLHLMADERL
jgi:hypothetical protein